jgi:hypothetical protein
VQWIQKLGEEMVKLKQSKGWIMAIGLH